MLNAIFVVLVAGSVVTAAFTGRMPEVMQASIDSAKTAKNFPKMISIFDVGVESSVSKVPRSFSPAVRSTAG